MTEEMTRPGTRVTRKMWLDSLHQGDIGLNLSRNPFAVLQRVYHHRFGEGNERASHGFIMGPSPQIMEANGPKVTRSHVGKFIGGRTKVWIFRAANATPEQIELMLAFVEGAKKSGGHYSVGGIIQFGLTYLGLRKKISDESGVFCTELTGLAIKRAGLPYIDQPAHTVTPSDQLNWFLTAGSIAWPLVATYDPEGGYRI